MVYPVPTARAVRKDLSPGNAPLPAKAQAIVERYQSAIIQFRTIVRKREALPRLVPLFTQMHGALSELASLFPAPDARGKQMAEYAHLAKLQLDFYIGLRTYQTPAGKQYVRNVLEQRFERRNGVLMTGLARHHAFEAIDPLHRGVAGTRQLGDEFVRWLDGIGDRDPADLIVDYLLTIDDSMYADIARSNSFDEARVAALELKPVDGKLHAYYTPSGSRYNTRTDSMVEYVAIQRRPYTSVGGGSRRGGGDFIQGDPYAVSTSGRIYSSGTETTHSEFFSGGRIRGAGLMVVQEGRVLAIDNRSGHYMPNWENLYQTLQLLSGMDVLVHRSVIGLAVTAESTMFFDFDDFMHLGRLGFPFEETCRVVRHYQRTYNALPVPHSKLQFIPAQLKRGWHDRPGNMWDLFLTSFFPKRAHEVKPFVRTAVAGGPLSRTA